MTVHIPIQNGFARRLVSYKTIEKSNIKINRKILLSIGKILICARTRYHTVESENKNCFALTMYCVISISFTLHYNISKISFFSLQFFSKMNTGIFFSLGKLHGLCFAWWIKILEKTILMALKIVKNSVTI